MAERLVDLRALGGSQLAAAHAASAKRSSTTVVGTSGLSMRQTLIALAAGASLSEHDNPGEATAQVLLGRMRLTTADGTGSWEVSTGQLLRIPEARHLVEALEDTVFLLSAVPRETSHLGG